MDFGEEYEVTSTLLVVTPVFTREVLDTVSGLSVEPFPPLELKVI